MHIHKKEKSQIVADKPLNACHQYVRVIMTTTHNSSFYKGFGIFDIFFPQMKPEQKKIELSDNKKAIFDILKTQKSMDLFDLKTQSGLSNKGWDKGIKGLVKHGLTKVIKTDDALIVDLQD